ncbi:hypothetical protein B2G50_19400 [Leptospira interrogans serovar Canicola]|nr:hypothetical protein B2G50_19400 [Leptospira interrogans serovar Canicola]
MFILPFFHKFKILDVSKKSSSLRILEINITPTNIFFRVYSLFQNLLKKLEFKIFQKIRQTLE